MTTENVMPTFDFSETLSDEAAADLLKVRSKVLEPGRYGFEIVEAVFAGPARKDPLWFKLKLKMAVAGDSVVHETLLVPTKSTSLMYEGKTKFPLLKCVSFLESIGEDANVISIVKTLSKQLGSDGSKLVGRRGEFELDYQDNHLEKIGEGEIAIVDPKGKTIKDGDGEGLVFPDYDSARAYAKDNNIELYSFVKVAKYVKGDGDKKAVNF